MKCSLLALTLLGAGLLTSSAKAQSITLNPNSPSNQGNGVWVATGEFSLPANTQLVTYTFGGIRCDYIPNPGQPGHSVTGTPNMINNPNTWTATDGPGAGTYTLPFKMYYRKDTYDSGRRLIKSENLYVEVSGTVTVL